MKKLNAGNQCIWNGIFLSNSMRMRLCGGGGAALGVFDENSTWGIIWSGATAAAQRAQGGRSALTARTATATPMIPKS